MGMESYILEMDDYFNYYISKRKTSDDLNKEVLFKDNNIIEFDGIAFKGDLVNSKKDLVLKFIESYKGVALSIQSLNRYDLYVVYEIVNDRKEFVLLGKDFHITSDRLFKDKTYYVEAYKKYDNYYLLSNVSEYTTCVFEKIKCDEDELDICIPVYNGELFLPRTLDSILLSNFNKYRIIIVNDGSKDNTLDVINWYKNKYNMFKVISLENQGVSFARNKGFEYVEAPYMAFIDADDIVSYNFYGDLYKAIVETSSDVAIAKTIIRDDYENDSVTLDIKTDDYTCYSYDKMAEEDYNVTWDNIFFVAVWNKIVKTDIAKKVRFPRVNKYEDTAYTTSMYTYASKFVFVGNLYYIWDKRKRITVGTYSTSYNNYSFDNVVTEFIESVLYALHNLNDNNKEYGTYQCVKLLVDYISQIFDYKDEVMEYYKSKLIEVCKSIDINNKYIKNNRELSFKVSCFRNM